MGKSGYNCFAYTQYSIYCLVDFYTLLLLHPMLVNKRNKMMILFYLQFFR